MEDGWREVDALFRRALDLPAGERRAWLAEIAKRTPDLAGDVESLLELAAASDGFLARPVEECCDLPWEEVFSRAGPSGSVEEEDVGFDRSGDRLGPYRLLRRIGRGGMASVYLAERDDGRWTQEVAVKILRRGLDTEDVVRRFRSERQILSSLDHPNIARLLDGGSTDDGLPYLVMEYVEGVPLTQYCDERRLPLGERLRLFCDVAHAVQCAHRSLVVHRDVKPSNILVDGEGRVKLLDFGIAKLLGEVPGMEATRTGPGVRTPGWASPEMIRRDPITTTSDVYQLGLLLCVLLTGRRPYRRIGVLSPARAEKAVLELDAVRPSSLVTDEAARVRGTATVQLRRGLAGDLDTIVLQAFHREPERRYESAGAMVEDVRRHLQGMPVTARPDTFVYRTRKFVGRHRMGVIAATGAVLALAATSLVSVVQADRARRERDRARTEAARAEQVTAFVSDLFEIADPDRSAGAPVSASALLEAGVRRAGSQLAGQPAAHADVLSSIGRMYATLGSYDDAREAYEKAVTLRRTRGDDVAKLVEGLWRLAQVVARSDMDRAIALLDEAVALAEEELGPESPGLAAALASYAEVLGMPGVETGPRKLALADRAVEILRGHQDDPQQRERLASALHASAIGRGHVEGIPRLEEALRIRRSLYGEEHTAVSATLHDMGLMLQGVDEAAVDSLLERAAEIHLRIHGPDHARTLSMQNSLAGRFRDRGEYARAEPLYRQVLRRRQEAYPDDSVSHAYSMHGLGWALAELGRGGEAEPLLREMLRILQAAGDDEGSLRYQVGRSALGRALSVQGRYAEAEPLLREPYEWMVENHPGDRLYLQFMLERLVRLYDDWGRPDEAEEYRRRLRVRQADVGPPGGE